MKNVSLYRKPLLIIGLIILLLVGSLPIALAGQGVNEELVHIKADEVIDDDLYATGDTIIIDGTIEGDLLAMGRIVEINGIIEGDLLAMAQSVTVNGEVQDDARIGAQVIVLNGSVSDDVNVGGFSVETRPGSTIGGDLLVGGFQALVDGDVVGNLRGALGGLRIGGQIKGNVNVDVGEANGGVSPVQFMTGIPDLPPMPVVAMGLTLESGSQIGGDLTYRTTSKLNFNEAAVAGNTQFIEQQREETESSTIGSGSWVWDQLQRLFRLLLVGLLAVWIAPLFVSQAGNAVQAKVWFGLGWGVLAFFLFPLVLLLIGLVSLLTGFPLLFFGSLFFGYLFVMFYLGAVIAGFWLGKAVLQRAAGKYADNLMAATLIGLVAIWLITVIPFAGPIIGFLIAMTGTGGIIMAAADRFKNREPYPGGPDLTAAPAYE